MKAADVMVSAVISVGPNARVEEVAEGNPLFIEETVRMLLDEELIVRHEGRWEPARDLSEAFVFFKHEDAGAGPRLAGDFLELMGRAELRRSPRAVGAPARATSEREVG